MAFKFPRQYLTFSELCAHWQCSENDLREAVISGELKPCIRMKERMRVPIWHDDGFGSSTPRACVEISGEPFEVKFDNIWLFLRAPRATAALDCSFQIGSMWRDQEPPQLGSEGTDEFDLPVDITQSAWLAEAFRGKLAGWFWLPRPFTMVDVEREAAFLKEEIARFEAAHSRGEGGPSALPAPSRELSTRERQNLQLCIGALLELALPAFGNKQDALIAEIQSRWPIRGLSERQLQGLIPKARQLLRSSS